MRGWCPRTCPSVKKLRILFKFDSNRDVQNVQIFLIIIKPKVPVNLNTDNILFEDLIYVATTFLPIVMTLKTQNTFK